MVDAEEAMGAMFAFGGIFGYTEIPVCPLNIDEEGMVRF